MPDITITLTALQYKAIRHFIRDPQNWVKHALKNKVEKCIDKAVVEITNLNPDKLSLAEKLQIIQDNTLDPK